MQQAKVACCDFHDDHHAAEMVLMLEFPEINAAVC
jgi:hypothetical protein